MKNISKIFIAAGFAVCASFQSCDKPIDLSPTGTYSDAVIFESTDNMDLFVKGLYTSLYSYACDINAGYVFDDSVTDLVKQSWYVTGGGTVNRFFYLDNVVTPEGNFRSNWGIYSWIRQLNEFIVDINNGAAAGFDQNITNSRYAEAIFLRALAHQELTLRHSHLDGSVTGAANLGVILRNNNNAVDGPNDNNKARSTADECWDFIISEYEAAAEALPTSWSGNDRGRITKGAALGMGARAALYARRWDKAIELCNAVLGLGQYNLVNGATASSYATIFSDPWNSELIFPVYFQAGTGGQSYKQHNFNSYFCPPYDGKAYNASVGAAATPTDEYASAFDIAVNGVYETFDWDHLATYGNKPYDNRDPRFYSNILYNDASWRGRKLQLYTGGTDGFMRYKDTGQDNQHNSTTGYIFRKFMSDASSMNYTSILSGQFWSEMRLAEIYLIRSEAYARKSQFTDAYADLNVIRKRAGMPEKTSKGDWEDYLLDLEKERICELAMEGHRYWDLLRWGIAEDRLDGKKLHGVVVTPKDGDFTYELYECDSQTRHFPHKYTVFPIPFGEIKNNPLCVQNDIWK